MELMHFFVYTSLWITLFLTIIKNVSAAPPTVNSYGQYPTDTVDRLDDGYYSKNKNRPVRRLYNELADLKSGYYYIENDSNTPSQRPQQRRQDNFVTTFDVKDFPNGANFKPVIRYKRTQTRHQKLFVPNFFG